MSRPKLRIGNSSPAAEMAAEAERQLAYALTNEEKEICVNVMVYGPAYLRQVKAWKAEEVKRFLARSEVVREINTLKSSYDDRSGIQERTQFFAQLKINSMVPTAIAVLAKTLRGVTKDAEGNMVIPPTRAQFEAAVEVLDRANIQGHKFNGNDATPSIDARSVQIAIGGQNSDFSALGAEGREKVTRILGTVMNKARALVSANDIAKGRTAKQAVEAKLGAKVTTLADDKWDDDKEADDAKDAGDDGSAD
jgi:hypothetical protein